MDSARYALYAEQWRKLAFEAHVSARLRGDSIAAEALQESLGPSSFSSQNDSREARLFQARSRLAKVVWQRWSGVKATKGRNSLRFVEAFEELARHGVAIEGKSPYAWLSRRISPAERRPSLLLLVRRPAATDAEVEALLECLEGDERVWAAFGIFRAGVRIQNVPGAVKSISAFTDRMVRRAGTVHPEPPRIPDGAEQFSEFFRRVLHGSPNALTFAILAATLRAAKAPFGHETSTLLSRWRKEAPPVLARLAGEMLYGHEADGAFRRLTEYELRGDALKRHLNFGSLAFMLLPSSDPLRMAGLTTDRDDTLGRIAAYRTSLATERFGTPPLHVPRAAHFGDLAIHGTSPPEGPNFLVSRRFVEFLHGVDLLQEMLTPGLSLRVVDKAQQLQEITTHLAIFRRARQVPHSVASALNASGAEWAAQLVEEGLALFLPGADPAPALEAVMTALVAWPGPRPSVGIVAGSVSASVGALTIGLTARSESRAAQLSRVALPGQILLCDPSDTAFNLDARLAYERRLATVASAWLAAERWGETTFTGGYHFESVWCIVSDQRHLTERRAAVPFRKGKA